MKRVVVFAHFDINNIVDDYVIYYLSALKKVADIVFVSCNPILNKDKLNGIADFIIDKSHKEYDFGSYKRGFLFLKEKGLLENYDELILANDSCFGPFYPLENIFEVMENKNCDFWGITRNFFGYRKKPNHFFAKRPHIQSYFVVLNKEIFTSVIFENFLKSIKPQNKKNIIVSNYEIGLTEILCENGFKYDVYINAYKNVNNITILKWRQIILNYKMPFIKCSLARLANKNYTTVEGYQDIINKVCNYPLDLIENNIKRTKQSEFSKYSLPIRVKRIFFDVLGELPFCLRKLIEFTIMKIFPFIKD